MRRRKLLTHILGGLALALLSLHGHAQSGGAYNNPVELKLQATTRRIMYGTRRSEPGQAFYTENFYPIGWSKNGNFAYYAEPVDEACGCYFAQLYILDLKSDKVLWKFDYQGDSTDEDRKAGKPYSLNSMWRINRKLFAAKLKEHGIIQQGRPALVTFPASYQGDRLTVDLKVKEKVGVSDDDRIYGTVGHLNLQLASRLKGKKTVLDYTYKPDEAVPLNVGALGFVKSPYEPRIAIILMEIYRGWEGPPNTGSVMIAGAHLETGFK